MQLEPRVLQQPPLDRRGLVHGEVVADQVDRQAGLDGVVALSGGWTLQGPYSPPNALFLWASGDPPDTRDPARALAARLAGVDAVQLGRSYGLLADLRGVRALRG